MHLNKNVTDFISLLNPDQNQIFNMSSEEAEACILTGDPEKVRSIDGSFAIVTKAGQQVYMARSISRPMRYFMAKQKAGPLLIVAERIDDIFNHLKSIGLHEQFRPEYTRMVPAHYLVRLDVVGCPDPNPVYKRYFTPERDRFSTDPDVIGRQYIQALAGECGKWLRKIPASEPIGVLFSGGVDSGSVFLVLYHCMLEMGLSPARLKAFTLNAGKSPDADQAYRFLNELGLSNFLEVLDVELTDLDYRETIRVIEDYKKRDVEAATATLAVCRKIRDLYPEWRFLADGDGGDENMKSYPIEENPELTIRSVLNNPLLYQEGWGVDKIKHSLTYSGGQSRGHVRNYATARAFGFEGFSPYSLPNVIDIAEGIPFIQLTNWKHEELYALKGDIVQRGVKAVTGLDMPVYPKRRFQEGAVEPELFDSVFPDNESEYKQYFTSLYAG